MLAAPLAVTNSFGLANALVLAEASRTARSGKAAIRAAHQADNTVKRIEYFNAADTETFILVTNDCTVVAFRGTEPSHVADWLTDTNYSIFDMAFETLGATHK